MVLDSPLCGAIHKVEPSSSSIMFVETNPFCTFAHASLCCNGNHANVFIANVFITECIITNSSYSCFPIWNTGTIYFGSYFIWCNINTILISNHTLIHVCKWWVLHSCVKEHTHDLIHADPQCYSEDYILNHIEFTSVALRFMCLDPPIPTL